MKVSVDGAELFYSTSGTGWPCLVPSVIGVTPLERLTLAPLTEHFQFVYVDVRGGGQSSGNPADLTFDRMASDFDAIRIALGVDRIAILGYSIAGVFAAEYARRCPDHVSHAILAGTPPTGDMRQLVAVGARFFEEDGSDERKRLLRENMARLPPGTPPSHAVLAQTPMRFFDPRTDAAALLAGSAFNPLLMAHVMGPLVSGWDIAVDPASLRVPLFIAHGRYDYTVPYILWDGVVEKLPTATFRLFEESGHQPFYEEPHRFVDAVTQWMSVGRQP